jgi:ribosomal protein L17
MEDEAYSLLETENIVTTVEVAKPAIEKMVTSVLVI